MCREVENEATAPGIRQGVSKEWKCKKYILLKSCNRTKGAQFSVNVSSAQTFFLRF